MKTKRFLSFLIAVLLISAIMAVLASCGNGKVVTVDDIKEAGKLKMGTESGFAPFEYVEGGEIVGIDIDIANEIVAAWGVELEIQDMDFSAVLTGVSTGVVDIGLAGITRTEERMKNMDFSEPYFVSYQVIVVRNDSDIAGKDDLNGKTIGAQAGTTGEELAAEIVGDANVVGYDKYIMAVQDLKNGQIDAIIMDHLPAQGHVNKNADEIKYIDTPIGEDNYCIAMKKGSADLKKAIDDILSEMKSSGRLDEIIQKYEDQLTDLDE